MECPYFAGTFMKYCVAERDVYMPSIDEDRDQCRLPQHKVCWRYMRTEKASARTNDVPRRHESRRTAA